MRKYKPNTHKKGTHRNAASDAPSVERTTGELSGTEVFVRVACSGPGEGPDPGFTYGVVELESPLLSFDDIEDVGVRGDLLLTAQGCEDGLRRYDGVASGWYDAPSELLVLDGVMDTDTDGDTLTLPVMAVMAATWSFVMPVLDDRTMSIKGSIRMEEREFPAAIRGFHQRQGSDIAEVVADPASPVAAEAKVCEQ